MGSDQQLLSITSSDMKVRENTGNEAQRGVMWREEGRRTRFSMICKKYFERNIKISKTYSASTFKEISFFKEILQTTWKGKGNDLFKGKSRKFS